MHYILCIPYVHTVCIGVHDIIYSTWHHHSYWWYYLCQLEMVYFILLVFSELVLLVFHRFLHSQDTCATDIILCTSHDTYDSTTCIHCTCSTTQDICSCILCVYWWQDMLYATHSVYWWHYLCQYSWYSTGSILLCSQGMVPLDIYCTANMASPSVLCHGMYYRMYYMHPLHMQHYTGYMLMHTVCIGVHDIIYSTWHHHSYWWYYLCYQGCTTSGIPQVSGSPDSTASLGSLPFSGYLCTTDSTRYHSQHSMYPLCSMHCTVCIPYVHTVCIGVHDIIYSTWHCILCIGAIACATRI